MVNLRVNNFLLIKMILKLSDLFRKLYPEEKVEIVKTKVIRNETLDLIVEKYKEGLENCGLYSEKKLEIKIPKNEFDIYYIAKSSAPSKISSDNITEFSLLLDSLLLEEHENKEYFEDFTGCYLSALINKSKDKDFKIITNYLTKTIDNIGYENAKNIVVNGNAGGLVGHEMENGKITINGNAGGMVGGGMKDGEIIINGNAGFLVGEDMKNGEIRLNGYYIDISDYIHGGNIYHKRKLIVENGRMLI